MIAETELPTALELALSGENAEREQKPVADSEANERRIKRQEIRERIARGRMLETKYTQLGNEIADRVARKERLSIDHVVEVQPLHLEISEIESAKVAAIVAKQPSDDAERDARHAQLLGELRERQLDLQHRVLAEERIIAALETERRETGMESTKAPAEHLLLESASEANLAALYTARSTLTWAERRAAAAAERLKSPGRWPRFAIDAEITSATAALALATEQAAAAFRAACDE